ncbi:MAG: SDR family NAD(P)-dependent oxidoreductase, partial [Myxococcota bacterium]
MPSQDKVPGEAGGAILVTGGSSGVGLGCTRHLAAAGLPVIVACRDLEGAAKAIGTITDETGNRDLRVVPLDLASLGSVRKLVQNLLQEGVRLRALVCNAGLQLAREIAFTEEGLELTFGVNHLGHFLLANLLIEHLVANAPTRILVVSSGVHDPALRTGMPNPDYTDFESLSRLGTPEEV